MLVAAVVLPYFLQRLPGSQGYLTTIYPPHNLRHSGHVAMVLLALPLPLAVLAIAGSFGSGRTGKS